MKKWVREGTSKIWYLKYRISEPVERKLEKNATTATYPQPSSKDCYQWRENMDILRAGKRMWNDPWQENWFCVSGQGRNNKNMKWKEVVAREKTKFEVKIVWGKRKVKWGTKRREGQNMWIEIHYCLKSSDWLYTNLLDKKSVKKLCSKEIVTHHEEDHSGFCLGRLLYLPLFFFFLDLPLVMSNVIPIWP